LASGLAFEGAAFYGAVAEVFEHGVGLVDLVADGAEVGASAAVLGAAGNGVLQKPADLGA
jgi:hypothetical protein